MAADSRESRGVLLVIEGHFCRSGSPSRRLGLVCGATRQRVVLVSPVTDDNSTVGSPWEKEAPVRPG